ncbi:protein tesmin/TSO1-like CXC 2 [Sesamum angolense]|uniref:Protein tesmin/TSO1-like CXC 2 n=1 Tax=Sesamum angolense TaxID=2727404 RepID=A0AAE1W8Z7_9LAMI|nr:protein tesmin/TSO1-like CXC 2 [Sesamum angolense]
MLDFVGFRNGKMQHWCIHSLWLQDGDFGFGVLSITCFLIDTDSPVFSYISNLSPIQPVKAPPVTQGFPGLNSPPLVFTSPRLNPHSQPTFLKGHNSQDYQLPKYLDRMKSPGCPDQFLTDVVNMDSVDPNIASDSTIEKSENMDQPQDAVRGSKELIIKHEETSQQMSVAHPSITREIKECPKIESELFGDHASTTPDQDSMTENVEAEHVCPSNQSTQLLSGSVQIEKDHQNSVEATEAVLTESVLNKVQNDPEAFQLRGVRRRCLQFENAHKVISNRPAQSPDSGALVTLSLQTPTPINGGQADTIQPMHPRNMNSTIKIPKPSGIGLHLNSIVNAVQAGSTAVVHVKSAQRALQYSLLQRISASTDDKRCESLASPAANSAASLSTYIVKPSDNSILDPVEDQSTPGNKRKYNNTETDASAEELKKKSSDSSDGDGGKKCNCKKSQCLKLGVITERNMRIRFLRHGNKLNPGIPLHSLLKLYSRSASHQQPVVGKMELYSRHPQQGTKEGAIARSPCVSKKYCECYQSNVGCSDGCRCEGCKNVYGRKGEYSMIKDVLSVEGTGERREGSFTEQIMHLEMALVKLSFAILITDSSDASSPIFRKYYVSCRGSPNTPTAQFSGHKPLQVIELESEFSNTLQDDTPDILKDSPTPLNAVKVSSPNKKRVSPPHGRQHEFSSSSSDGLRTGRKFILKAFPHFHLLPHALIPKAA